MRSEQAARESVARPESARGVVLVLDDEELLLSALERILRPEGHEVRLAPSLDAARHDLSDPALDVVLVDLFLGNASGLDVLDWVARERLEVEVIVMTGHASIESAVGCMRRGAFDYLAKPFEDVHRVRATVGKAIERRRLVRRNRELEEVLRGRGGAAELVGRSAGDARALLRTIESLRHNESNVLIQGESGTGKELVARAMHAASPRRGAARSCPSTAARCPRRSSRASCSDTSAAPSPARPARPGSSGSPSGGTLFLDEIGELPLDVQAKLLRALQQREVRPVGAASRCRSTSASSRRRNRDLAAMVEAGRFRADLFYRLNVVRIDVPPLRERMRGRPAAGLALPREARAAGRARAVPRLRRAREAPRTTRGPGNVRELENAVESALALARGPTLRAGDFGFEAPSRSEPAPPPDNLPLRLDAYERCALERALHESGGDATLAARRLGIGRSTFYRKLARHGIRRLGA